MPIAEHKGLWWLPGDSTPVAGILRIAPAERPKLQLIGVIPESFALSTTPQIMLGTSTAGKPFTLYRCFVNHSTISGGGAGSAELSADFAIEGVHFPSPESIRFESMAVSYQQLGQWTRLSGLGSKVELAGDSLHFTARYNYPEGPRVAINGWTIAFHFVFNDEPSLEQITFRQRTYFQAVPTQPKCLECFLDDVFYHIRNFVSLGVGAPTHMDGILGFVSGSENGRVETVNVYSQSVYETPASDGIHPLTMLFSAADLKDDYDRALQAWFAKADLLRPIYDLYFGTLFAPDLYLETAFLNVAQAVESYHRRRYPGTPLTKEQFRKLRKELCAVIKPAMATEPAEIVTLLESKIAFFNEYSLKMRIKKLIATHAALATLFIDDVDRFVTMATNTRNYLTHFSGTLVNKRAEGRALYDLMVQLKFLLQICLLSELELPEETIRTLMTRNQRIAWFRQTRQSSTSSVAAHG
jgi:hypothetical protein